MLNNHARNTNTTVKKQAETIIPAIITKGFSIIIIATIFKIIYLLLTIIQIYRISSNDGYKK